MSSPTVSEYVEYCHTQAGLLAGRIETLQTEADRLLDEIDAETETVRTELESAQAGDSDPEAAVEAIEAKQESVRELQREISRCSDAASGYTELAGRLAERDDASEVLAEIVQFELENEVYDCLEDRTTLAEEVAGIGNDGG